MPTAAELRAEAAHLRQLARGVTDARTLTEINLMIAELELRAREMGDGDATDD